MEDQTIQKISEEARKSEVLDRIRGVILGAACANSLGGSCIGVNYKDIVTTVGISRLRDYAPGHSKSTLPDHQAGELLADAYLAMSLAESLVATQGRFNDEDLRRRFRVLLEDEHFLRAAPGVHCLASLRRMADSLPAAPEGVESQHASAAARAFPAGCLPGPEKSDKPVDVAVAQARLTHGSQAVAAAAVVADSISYFLTGGKLSTESDVRDYVQRELRLAQPYDERFAESWDNVAPDLNYEAAAEELPYSLHNVQSDVNELVPTAVGIFLIFRHSLEEAVCAAARSGGDTDTAAIIVGALAGAYHGASKIPERWLSGIAHRQRLESIAQGLANLWF